MSVLSGALCVSIAATTLQNHNEMALESKNFIAATTFEASTDDNVWFFEPLKAPPPSLGDLVTEPRIAAGPPFETKVTKEQTPKRDRIYILGDSIMQGAQVKLQEVLTRDGWEHIEIQASCGRPLIGTGTYRSCDPDHNDELTGLQQIEHDQESISEADQVIVALGTNDYNSQPATFANAANQAIEHIKTINPDVPVAWVNTFLTISENYRPINAVIQEAGVEVIDFASEAPSHYDLPECPDGIHPCQSGYEALARLVLKSIE